MITASDLATLLFDRHSPEDVPYHLEVEITNEISLIMPDLFNKLDADGKGQLVDAVSFEMIQRDISPYDVSHEREYLLSLNRFVADVYEDLWVEAMPIYRAMLNQSIEADRVSAHCKGY